MATNIGRIYIDWEEGYCMHQCPCYESLLRILVTYGVLCLLVIVCLVHVERAFDVMRHLGCGHHKECSK